MKKVFMLFTVFVLIAGFCAGAALAGDYPTKPITIIVPWGAGGMSNVSTRMLGEQTRRQRHCWPPNPEKGKAGWVYDCFGGLDLRVYIALFF